MNQNIELTEIIKDYFNEGHTYAVIVDMLSALHSVKRSSLRWVIQKKSLLPGGRSKECMCWSCVVQLFGYQVLKRSLVSSQQVF